VLQLERLEDRLGELLAQLLALLLGVRAKEVATGDWLSEELPQLLLDTEAHREGEWVALLFTVVLGLRLPELLMLALPVALWLAVPELQLLALTVEL
jgi:hypothetical protein